MVVILVFALALAAAPPATVRAASRIYVAPGGAGSATGADWANAMDLAPALADAAQGDELWLRAGTYTPGAPGNHAATFTIPDGVAVYGGFAGDESERAERDPAANLTVLSGDLAGDDAAGSRSENSSHVVTFGAVGPDTILDGVTVSEGGGGDGGGAIRNEGGSPQLANLTLTANTGGAMWTRGDPTLTNVSLSANSGYLGGAIFNDLGTLTLNRVTFDANRAKGGGAIWNQGDLIAIGSSFVGNQGTVGGAIYHQGGIASMINCRFEGNMAFNAGGAFHSIGGLNSFTNTAFVGNTTGGAGGAVWMVEAAPVFTNVVFSGNKANQGGALHLRAGNLSLTNVTASGNEAAATGGFFTPNVSVAIANSIIWDNPGGNLGYDLPDGIRGVIRHSLIEGGVPAFLSDGGFNLSADPRFLAPVPPAPSVAGNLRLAAGSPAIDSGDASLLPGGVAGDIEGRRRVSGASVDMGAYEYAPSSVRMLYDEAYDPLWGERWSWGASATPVSDPVANGAAALSVSYAYGWGGFRLMSPGDDWGGYRVLRFALHGGVGGGHEVRVWLRTATGAAFTLGVATAPPGHWTTAELALPAGADLSAVTELVFQEHRGLTPAEPYFLDQVALVPVDAPAGLYDDGYGRGWGERWSWGATATPVASPVASGAAALSVSYAYGWGGFRLMSPGDDWASFRALRFAIYGGVAGGHEVRVWLRTATGEAYTLGVARAPAGLWATAELALPAGADLSTVTELVFQEHRGLTPPEPYFLDGIELAR